MRRFIKRVVLVGVCSVLAGCATTYKISTGDKARLDASAQIASVLFSLSVLSQANENWKNIDPSVEVQRSIDNYKHFAPAQGVDLSKSYEKLSGDRFIIRTGQQQKDIVNYLGLPLGKSRLRWGKEKWIYKDFIVHFKSRRVKEVEFLFSKDVFYMSKSDRWLELFPKIYYSSGTMDLER